MSKNKASQRAAGAIRGLTILLLAFLFFRAGYSIGFMLGINGGPLPSYPVGQPGATPIAAPATIGTPVPVREGRALVTVEPGMYFEAACTPWAMLSRMGCDEGTRYYAMGGQN